MIHMISMTHMIHITLETHCHKNCHNDKDHVVHHGRGDNNNIVNYNSDVSQVNDVDHSTNSKAYHPDTARENRQGDENG